jgi:hypothetical protein
MSMMAMAVLTNPIRGLEREVIFCSQVQASDPTLSMWMESTASCPCQTTGILSTSCLLGWLYL